MLSAYLGAVDSRPEPNQVCSNSSFQVEQQLGRVLLCACATRMAGLEVVVVACYFSTLLKEVQVGVLSQGLPRQGERSEAESAVREDGTCTYDAEQVFWKQASPVSESPAWWVLNIATEQATLGIDKPDLLIARAPKPSLVGASGARVRGTWLPRRMLGSLRSCLPRAGLNLVLVQWLVRASRVQQ